MKKVLICVCFLVCLFAEDVTYMVKQGDTLWDIAGFYYQNPYLWPVIWNANLEKVSDPHWIYPEQVLIIPPSPESTLAGDSVPIVAPETLVIVEEDTTTYTYYAPKPHGQEIEVSFVAADRKVFSEELIHRCGYLAEEEIIAAAKIIRSEPERERITNFMKVYVDRTTPETNVGDVYSIYRMGDVVDDPATGQYLGKVVDILGKLKIEEAAEGGTRAQVTVSHDIIKPGELLVPYPKFEIPTNVTLKVTSRLLEGQVAYVRSKTTLTQNYTIVFLNVGANSDVTIGDVFRIYEEKTYGGRKLPDLSVGEVLVVNARPSSCVGLVSWRRLTHKIVRGDKVRLYQEAH